LRGAKVALEKAASLRQFEDKFLSVAQGTVGFLPKDDEYESCKSPWTDLSDDSFGITFPGGMLPPSAIKALDALAEAKESAERNHAKRWDDE
jgi:hypothetical protein